MLVRARPDARDVVKSCWQLDRQEMVRTVTAMAETNVTADLRIDSLQSEGRHRAKTRAATL
jgi:hypothetical protein